MKKLLLLAVLIALGGFAYQNGGNRGVKKVGEQLASKVDLEGLSVRAKSIVAAVSSKTDLLPKPRNLSGNGSRWTFADGTQMDAVLVAADIERAQFRVLESQGVGQLNLDLLSEQDRGRIQDWVRSEGTNGVAGYPLRLKTHPWPQQWREQRSVALERIGDSNRWKSKHFEITNAAGVEQEALESITLICESVDGALSALPLPLPVNWGRPNDDVRKIIIERGGSFEGMEGAAGFWEARTGNVHVNADSLLERDRHLIVFEFDKPEKVQKYDVIVHEVVHQSTAALLFLGAPAWVTEGLAEYLSATQFAPAYYEFTNTHVAVRHHINKGLLGERIPKERRMNITRLEAMMNRSISDWNRLLASGDVSGALQYSEALLLMDYFFHRDHPDGVHFRRYLESVLSGVPEKEAHARHLLRGRSYEKIEAEMHKLWKPLGFAIRYGERGELLAGDVEIDWDAEEVKRTIASRRAMASREN